jgi:hypothetical protein
MCLRRLLPEVNALGGLRAKALPLTHLPQPAGVSPMQSALAARAVRLIRFRWQPRARARIILTGNRKTISEEERP